MASNSLNFMSVPVAAGTDTGAPGAILMPKLQYRFRVLFRNFGTGTTAELTKQVVDVTRPTLTFPEIPLNVYNSRIYLAGKPEWNSVTVTLRDDASSNVAGGVGSQIQKQFDFLEQASAASGIDYKFTMAIQILDGGLGNSQPNVLEAWELYGCFIQSANYQTLNYGSNEPVTIQLTIRYDNALQGNLDAADGARSIGVGVGGLIGSGVGNTVAGAGSSSVPSAST